MWPVTIANDREGLTSNMADQPDKVRVRVNFSGKRYVGHVHLPAPGVRITDVLNNGKLFLHLENVQTTDEKELGGTLGMNKGGITFVQVIEEGDNDEHKVAAGEFLHVEITMRGMDQAIRGGIFIPEGTADAGDIINDNRDFLSLNEVEVVGTSETYPFLAVSKQQCISILWRYFAW